MFSITDFGKSKKVLNDNGENIIYFQPKKKGVKSKFFKKHGILDGEFYTYYIGGTVQLKANFNNGKIDGNCYDYSISGGINRVEEKYDNGFLINRKVYFTASKRGELASENNFSIRDKKKGIIQEDIEGFINQIQS